MEPSAPEPSRDTKRYAPAPGGTVLVQRSASLVRRLHRSPRASHAQSCMLNRPRNPIDFARAADRLQCPSLKENQKTCARDELSRLGRTECEHIFSGVPADGGH